GVKLGSLAAALGAGGGSLEAHLANRAKFSDAAFTALNTAFFSGGALLEIPAGAMIETPIFLVFLSTGGGEPAICYPRTLVVAGADCRMTLIECYAGPETGAYFTDAVTEISAAPGAVIDHYKLQREGGQAVHIASLQVHLDAGAAFTSSSMALGGSFVRNDVAAVLDGEGAECTLDGLFLATGRRLVDNHTLIDHARPHGTSRETYKGILDEAGR